MTFADKILSLRKQANLTQEELAEKLEVSRQAISRWEMGTALPDAANLLRMSKLFGVTVDYLVNDEYASERDLPIVKKTEVTVKDETKKQGAFILLVGSQILAFLVEGLAVALGLCGYQAAFLALFFSGIAITLGSIIAFEVVFRKCEDSVCRKLRKKYYRICVWFFTFFPILTGMGTLISEAVPPITLLLLILITYLLICSIITVSLRQKTSVI